MNLRIAVALATGFLFSSGVFAQGNPPQNGQTTPPAGAGTGRQSTSGPVPTLKSLLPKQKQAEAYLPSIAWTTNIFLKFPTHC